MWKQVGFLSLVFIVFQVTAVALDTNFAILGVQNLSFGGLLPPFYHPGDHFVRGHPGGPWEQQEGHVGVRSKMTESTPRVIGVAGGER